MKFFKKKEFWINLGIIFALGIIFLIGSFFSISLYTRHGKSFPLPDFKGLTEHQLQSIIKNRDLRYIIIDSVYHDDIPKGIVIEQVPKAGEHVKKNRKIFFTINAWSEEQVSIPNLTDYSLRNAKVVLESYGLKLGELIYIPSEYSNLVYGQQLYGKPIESGEMVPKGTVIDLLIGRGLSNELTNVPNLKGLNKNTAEQVLHSLTLFFGAIIYDETVTTPQDTAKAFVWRQSPSAKNGARLNLGASIDIWLTTDDSLLIPDDEEDEDEEDGDEDFDTYYDDELF
jgi:beta-lactam-binding protein with PASTA domain